ncbi:MULTISPECIES: DUF262 domain-containing protein [Roseofilum]|uniref:DUF262 domain-containing HNH endonuclease family protein n=2 Tax=Roseofilum TaxID=1233426 RepID=A0ABT7B1S2_9CYAN|nr:MULTISPECIES: DUF262 domain-containing HNH endonuclease family protein [Roseofilum]MDJ1172105.1 DUF262 domain-containing HNH endonuclease family protein [Roseofilum acuticapitatum BLCC-M154]MDJ1173115.1 DUF262 domain-containing HNH endonuclease family protein [Roseofilum capinflatum BLCC-M114]
MSNIPTIESKNLSIADLFQDFYTVPNFQREYVWKEDNVKKLLEDLFEGLGLYEYESSNQFSEYFLGSIVVCPDRTDDKKTFQLIDGQQRLTTVYLIFCAIRDCIKELGDESRVTENLIKGFAQDMNTGEDIDKYRLSLQYDSLGQKILDCILEGDKYEQSLLKSSQSAQNIDKAWKLIKNFLNDNLEANSKKFKEACSFIANRTKLIRIESPNLKNALKVFETINERGIGLNPVDLLKNYLFIHTSNGNNYNRDWSSLTKKWQEFLTILSQHKQEPLSFMRYYLMSHYPVNLSNTFPEEEIYDWFLENQEKHEIQKNPIKFIETLTLAAEHYCKFTIAKNIDNSDNYHLKNLAQIQGRSKQQLILLLSGRFLRIDLFNKLSLYLENLFFVYAITRKTRRKDFNLGREFARWSKHLRLVKTSEELDSFIEKYFIPELNSLKDDFRQSLLQLSESNLAKYRLRYILAKISQFVEKTAYGNSKELGFYLDKNITIEHILPQSRKNLKSQKLGNLTLLEKTINSSISDNDYDDKLSGYQQSQILITRSLSEIPHVGNDTQLNRAMSQLGLVNFKVWDDSSIDQRQEMLVNIAMKVWGLDI